jgi:hypothetical protein
MEWYMALLWMVSAMILSSGGLSILSIAIHILILTGLSLLVIEDMRTRIISDSSSVPLMGVILVIFLFLRFFPLPTLLPEGSSAVLGAFTGMLFYMLQMIVPAAYEAARRHKYGALFEIGISPFIFPLWIVTKAFL